jgi:ATP-dependent DNA ligase
MPEQLVRAIDEVNVHDRPMLAVYRLRAVGYWAMPTSPFAIAPPIEPMLAKLAGELPSGDGFLYEPKWDGFRAIAFRGGGEVFIQSRDLRPLDRYFPELHAAFLAGLPDGCVVDGEIVIATPKGLDFDALQLRLHPAASRVARLACDTPAAFVAFDLVAVDGRDLRAVAQNERRVRLERLLADAVPPIFLTPMTRDRGQAAEWLSRFEGAGLDGVMAKATDGRYLPGKRAMIKVKHARTADCVVAGFRWHKAGKDELVGSLLLGLYDDARRLHHVGVTSSFTMAMRRQLAIDLAPLDGGNDTHAGRPEPLERGKGSVVGGASNRARLRSEIRSHAGLEVPSRGDLLAMATRQAPD